MPTKKQKVDEEPGLADVRSKLAELMTKGGAVTDADRETAQTLMEAWTKAGGSTDDSAFTILSKAFGANPPVKSVKVDKTRIPFDYLEEFMFETLRCYDVPEEEARVAADVLIGADKRGIDSHGIGRLKPIYCDRFDAGIMKPSAPLTIVKETETTALVDGGIGLGLVIGPKCMQMAIDKAKKHGLGMVVCRNSTHYGAACYYPLMAEKEGMIAVTGTNARASIAPTHGVDACLGQGKNNQIARSQHRAFACVVLPAPASSPALSRLTPAPHLREQAPTR